MATGRKPGGVTLFLGVWGVNLAVDAASRAVPALTPPHLLHAYMPEAIRDMVSAEVIAPMASAVLAAIALLVLSLVPPGTPRRWARLTAWLLGFWVLSEGLLAWVWLDAPATVVLVAVTGGLPRSALVAWLFARLDRGETGVA